MLAAMFYAPGDLRLEERPIPQPGPGEVLLQVAAATTCGTDLKTFRRGHPLLFRQTPAGFGHEVSGTVAATGAGVTKVREGGAVAVANSAPCYQCFYCKRGRYSLCEDLLLLNGAYAEYLLMPARIVEHNLYPLPAGTSFIAAALAEPLACALHGVGASDIHAGDTVIVLGSGPLGLLLSAAATLCGARVVLTGRGEERLRLGTYFGAACVIDVTGMTPQEQYEAVRDQTEERRGADVVIEAIGTPETWQLAARLARPGGLVNLFGGCASGTQVALETRPLHYSELTIKGVFHHTPSYYAQALHLIAERQIDVEALVTRRLPLHAALEAINLLTQKKGVKYALIPPAFASLLDGAVSPD
ncbi:alcohol dehydrogenase catalytic domain-containing protein [Ktedonobacter racemifer]|uniref:Alcohol dehydrogenase zinc-binding domain protein n=1 Tax=Ktedonobacter racemifer DSM 44963 TaxID=485913 RepID=D6TBJ2_KTERA|nr:alcohol dehydrogenase catalytic domain-containing protein [Ktedonobacter racemifer]EFH87976.1 Alcohol dehydrogenase zinc-binding domain protein [Ktedonobacter racemifer DSM 44963]